MAMPGGRPPLESPGGRFPGALGEVVGTALGAIKMGTLAMHWCVLGKLVPEGMLL